jgi:hypothetical protein
MNKRIIIKFAILDAHSSSITCQNIASLEISVRKYQIFNIKLKIVYLVHHNILHLKFSLGFWRLELTPAMFGLLELSYMK